MSKRPYNQIKDGSINKVSGDSTPKVGSHKIIHRFDNATINSVNQLGISAMNRSERAYIAKDVDELKLARDEYVRAIEMLKKIKEQKNTGKSEEEIDSVINLYLEQASSLQLEIDALEGKNAIIKKENQLDEANLDEDTIKRRNGFRANIITGKVENIPKTKIIGVENVEAQIDTLLKINSEWPELKGLGGKNSSNFLLYGPSGTGKTLLAKTTAAKNNINFLEVKSSDLLTKWFGESEKFVADLFAVARENQPIIIFLDEFDSLAKDRGEADEASARVVTSFLVALDGFGSNPEDEITIIAATNNPKELDPAILTRFNRKAYLPLPVKDNREAQMKAQLSNKDFVKIIPVSKKIDYGKLAKETEGYSNREIDNILGEALSNIAIEAVTKGNKELRTLKTNDILKVIKDTPRSTSKEQLLQYEEFQNSVEKKY